MAKEEKKVKKDRKHFWKDFKVELKKVIWPTTKQLTNSTIAVITIVLITAVIVFVLDFVFLTMDTYGINKLKSKIGSNQSDSQVITEGYDAESTEQSQEGSTQTE